MTTLAENISVKSASVELLHAPDSICKVIGPAPSAAWDVLPLSIKDVAKASYGLAEKAVGIVKTHLKRMDSPATPMELFANIASVLVPD